jgi:hypothetical protein
VHALISALAQYADAIRLYRNPGSQGLPSGISLDELGCVAKLAQGCGNSEPGDASPTMRMRSIATIFPPFVWSPRECVFQLEVTESTYFALGGYVYISFVTVSRKMSDEIRRQMRGGGNGSIELTACGEDRLQ